MYIKLKFYFVWGGFLDRFFSSIFDLNYEDILFLFVILGKKERKFKKGNKVRI